MDYKLVSFPIIRHVVYGGETMFHKLDKGQTVSCYYCKNPIKIDRSSVFVGEDGVPVIKCLNEYCGKNVSVLYYFDRIIDDTKDKKLKKPLRTKHRARKDKGACGI